MALSIAGTITIVAASETAPTPIAAAETRIRVLVMDPTADFRAPLFAPDFASVDMNTTKFGKIVGHFYKT
jgi:hypothetical protein